MAMKATTTTGEMFYVPWIANPAFGKFSLLNVLVGGDSTGGR